MSIDLKGISKTKTKFYSSNSSVGSVKSKTSNTSRITHIPTQLASPWCVSFIFDESDVTIPMKLLYEDYRGYFPLETVNLSGWKLSTLLFQSLSIECKRMRTLNVEDCHGVTVERMEQIRGHPKLSTMIMKRTLPFSPMLSRIVASWPSLTELDISGCMIEPKSFQILSTSCSVLRRLKCQGCPGLDDLILIHISELITRFHKLQYLDLTNSVQFTDEGILIVMVAGANILRTLMLSGCRGLSTLSIAGLRKKMSVLETLEISNLSVSVSAFEWIPEGCIFVKHLDLGRCVEIDDLTLILIGKKCKKLEFLLLAKCIKITDVGVVGFMQESESLLKLLDLSGCAACGSEAAVAIGTKAMELIELRLNGLSQMSTEGLKAIWSQSKKLERFEMCAELKNTTGNRKSMVPHISDTILKTVSYSTLKEVKLSGACLVTDLGACSLVMKCTGLTSLDVGYCNGISDKLLQVLGMRAKLLTSLVVSGCNKVGDAGLKALCRGCVKLIRLESAGCVRITDDGLASIATLRHLEVLNIRNCDRVTDIGLSYLAESCHRLRVLDTTSLDLVSAVGIGNLTSSCFALTTLTCNSCNLTPTEFSACTRFKLPLGQPAPAKCNLEPRPRAVYEYNKYVITVREQERSVLVLQRFARRVNGKMFRLHLSTQRAQSALGISRVFRGHMGRLTANGIRKQNEALYLTATGLQKAMKSLYCIHIARKKYLRRRCQSRSAILIQRFYRGHMSRKRSKARVLRRAYFDKCLVILVYKLVLMTPVRRLRSLVVKVQANVRRFLQQHQRFTKAKNGFIQLSYCIRYFLKHKRAMKEKQRLARLEYKRQKYAATVLSRNWRIYAHNKQILTFVTDCAIYYGHKYDQEYWYITKIQAAWRGYACRIKLFRDARDFVKRTAASIRIQTAWRRHSAIPKFKAFRRRMKRISARCRRLLKAALKYYYSIFAKKIQRAYRRYVFRQERIWGCSEIQRVYRGHRGRLERRRLLDELADMYASRIQRQARVYLARLHRKQYIILINSAAEVIQRGMRCHWAFQAKKRKYHEREVERQRQVEAAKEAARIARMERAVENIRLTSMHRHAIRIQRRWRHYKAVMDKWREAEARRKFLMDEEKSLIQPVTAKLAEKALDPAKRALRGLRNIFGNNDLTVSPQELQAFENSILKYQTQSISQAGIADLKLTVGAPETNAFAQRNKFLKNTRMPYFYQVDGGDVSGFRDMDVGLWLKWGSGVECICDMKLQLKPPKTSLATLEAREANMKSQGVRVAWHQNLIFEVHGIQSLKQGQPGYAIDSLRVCRNPSEATQADVAGYYLVSDLEEFGFPTTIWAKTKKRVAEFAYPHSKRILLQDWFDKRMDKAIQTYSIEEKAVFLIRETFERALGWAEKDGILTTRLFKFLDMPLTQLSFMVVESINPENRDLLTFSEYFHLVCAVCMLGKSEMTRMAFKHGDKNQIFQLEDEEFGELLEFMTEGLPGQRGIRQLKKMYKDFLDIDTLAMTLESFQGFIDHNPRVLWCFENLQQAFMRVNLGSAYWERKMVQFKKIREAIGVVALK